MTGPRGSDDRDPEKLPPRDSQRRERIAPIELVRGQHLELGANGILRDLELLGIVQRLVDQRIQMPDVYRIAFGLGRRGGVKPLK